MRLVLIPNLIPKVCWGKNLRNILGQVRWKKLRSTILAQVNDERCQICFLNPHEDLHEHWLYSCDGIDVIPNDTKLHSQVLGKLTLVCKNCHDCIHFGRSSSLFNKGKLYAVLKHLADVNSIDIETARELTSVGFSIFDRRNLVVHWQQVLSNCEKYCADTYAFLKEQQKITYTIC